MKNDLIFCTLCVGCTTTITPAMEILAEAYSSFTRSEEDDFFKYAAWEFSVVVMKQLEIAEKKVTFSESEIKDFFLPDNLFRLFNGSDHRFALEAEARNNREKFDEVFGKYFKYLATIVQALH